MRAACCEATVLSHEVIAADIRLLDHIIVADHDFVSLADSGYC